MASSRDRVPSRLSPARPASRPDAVPWCTASGHQGMAGPVAPPLTPHISTEGPDFPCYGLGESGLVVRRVLDRLLHVARRPNPPPELLTSGRPTVPDGRVFLLGVPDDDGVDRSRLQLLRDRRPSRPALVSSVGRDWSGTAGLEWETGGRNWEEEVNLIPASSGSSQRRLTGKAQLRRRFSYSPKRPSFFGECETRRFLVCCWYTPRVAADQWKRLRFALFAGGWSEYGPGLGRHGADP